MPPTITGERSIKYRRGDDDIVLVPFPFSDLTTTKVRPAVVVSSDLYHTTEPDLVLAALTSRVAAATGPLDYVLGDWEKVGLRYPSALKPVFFTLTLARVLHRIGTLTPQDAEQIDRRLCLALALEKASQRQQPQDMGS